MTIKALLFDVGGSVFDWRSAIVQAVGLTVSPQVRALDAEAFSHLWREKSLIEMYDIAEQRVPWCSFDSFMLSSLDDTLASFGVEQISPADRRTLALAWSNMPAWPEIPAALKRLRTNFLVAPHTILGTGPVARSSKAAGLTWDAIISCDLLRVTKTHPDSYRLAVTELGFEIDEVCYVAAHASDLRVVRDLGLMTAYVESRLDEYAEDPGGTDYRGEFDVIARDYNDLADQMLAWAIAGDGSLQTGAE